VCPYSSLPSQVQRPPQNSSTASRFNDRVDIIHTQYGGDGNPPTRLADSLNKVREDVDDQSGAAGPRALVIYTMVAIAGVAAMLWKVKSFLSRDYDAVFFRVSF
jgi:hypothetical protein